MVKCQYSSDKISDFNLFFGEGGGAKKHLGFLEKMSYFGDVNANRRLSGAFAIACILNILVTLEASVLGDFPNLNSFYEAMIVDKAFDGLKDQWMYIQRN